MHSYSIQTATPILHATRLRRGKTPIGGVDEDLPLFEKYSSMDSLYGLLIVRDDEPPVYNKTFCVYNPRDMTGPPVKCGHEVIYGTFPQKLRFDIDAKEPGMAFTGDDLKTIINKIIEEWISRYLVLGVDMIDEEDIYVFDSSLPEQNIHSYHILVSPTQFAVANYTEAEEFAMGVYRRLCTRIQTYMDIGVYKGTQSFRMAGCQKSGSGRIKRLMVGYDPDARKPLSWPETLISNVHGLEILPCLATVKPMLPSSIDCTDSQRESPHISYVLKRALETGWTVGFKLRDIRVSSNGNDIHETQESPGEIATMDEVTVNINSRYILQFDRISPSYCKICTRVHEHDNSLLIQINVYDNGELKAYAKCHRNLSKKFQFICEAKVMNAEPDISQEYDLSKLVPVTLEEVKANRKNKVSSARALIKGEVIADPKFNIDNEANIESCTETDRSNATVIYKGTTSNNASIFRTNIREMFKLPPTRFDTWFPRIDYCEPIMRPLVSEDYSIFPRTLCVDAPMKMGKTKELIRTLESYFSDEHLRICVLSFRQTFSQNIYERLSHLGFQVYSKVDGNLSAYQRIIVQIESLHRIIDTSRSFDLVILDECESIFEQIDSGLAKQFGIAFCTFEWMLRTAGHVICMDAYIGDRTFRIIEDIRKLDGMVVHRNRFLRAADDIYTITDDEGQWLGEIIQALNNKERIVIATNCLKIANTLREFINEQAFSVQVGLYSSDTAASIKSTHFADVDTYWKQYDVLIYTPTVSAGVSFEAIHYDRLFGYFTSTSCTVETAMQMIGRVRNLSSQTYFIFIKDSWWAYDYLPITTAEIKEALIERQWQLLGKDLNMGNLQFKIEAGGRRTVKNSEYMTIWLENTRVRNYSRRYFLTHFLATVQKAGATICRLQIHEHTREQFSALKKQFKDFAKIIAERKSRDIARANDITPSQYADIGQRLRESRTLVVAPKRAKMISKISIHMLLNEDKEDIGDIEVAESAVTADGSAETKELDNRIDEICGAERPGDNPIADSGALSSIIPADVTKAEKDSHTKFRLKRFYHIKSEARLEDDFAIKYDDNKAKKIYKMISDLRQVYIGECSIDDVINAIRATEITKITNSGLLARSFVSSLTLPKDNITGLTESIADQNITGDEYYSDCHAIIQKILSILGWKHIFDKGELFECRLEKNINNNINELQALKRPIILAFGITNWKIPDSVRGHKGKKGDKDTLRFAIESVNKLLERYDMVIKKEEGNSAAVSGDRRKYYMQYKMNLFRFSSYHGNFVVSTMEDNDFDFGPATQIDD